MNELEKYQRDLLKRMLVNEHHVRIAVAAYGDALATAQLSSGIGAAHTAMRAALEAVANDWLDSRGEVNSDPQSQNSRAASEPIPQPLTKEGD